MHILFLLCGTQPAVLYFQYSALGGKTQTENGASSARIITQRKQLAGFEALDLQCLLKDAASEPAAAGQGST
ncbi:MAG TPA: hypothetical protein H9790_02195 [Candidatus Agathobaculum intestinipullorum]|nr:hypothetical protein [Candidatus Agathobaculum intestinipullorum]